MIYLHLFTVFFKIGLFSFGGGLAIIAVIQQEVVGRGWLSTEEYAQIVTISQITPGPVAVNAATFVGARVPGGTMAESFLGSLVATLGVTLPSFLLVLLVAGSLKKFSGSPVTKSLLMGIRPAIIGFMLSAALIFFKLSVFPSTNEQLLSSFNPVGFLLSLLFFYLHFYKNVGPIPLILLAAAGGLAFF